MSPRAAARLFFLLLFSCGMAGAALSPARAEPWPQTAPSRPAAPKRKLPSPSQPAAAAPRPMTRAEREEMTGDIFMARKMYNKAIESYQDVLLDRGISLKEQEQRRSFFQRLFGAFGASKLPQDHENAVLFDKIGIAYQQMDNVGQAETFYMRSSESDKHFASPLNNLGTIEFGRKNYKSAVKWYAKAIKVNPTVASTFSNMGYAYLAWNRSQDAIVAFRQAVLLDPGIFENRGDLGAVVESNGGANPGLYYYTLAKTFAMLGNAEQCAHFLQMSRDEGYKKYTDALKDPAFHPVLQDQRVLAILSPAPAGTPSPTN
jgi:tetratricopeptide (TPR) repeat protein